MTRYLGRWSLGFAASVLVALQAFAGTMQLVSNINSSMLDYGSSPRFMGKIGDSVVFQATDAAGLTVWISDGSVAGTRMLTRMEPSGGMIQFPDLELLQVADRHYFAWRTNQVWSTDGTVQGTRLYLDMGGTYPLELVGAFNGRVVFRQADANFVEQLYITDGTASGTQQLSSFSSLNPGAVSNAFISLQNKFYVTVRTGEYNGKILVSDGTPSGTREIHNATSGEPDALSFVSIGDQVLVRMSALWKIDIATDAVTAVPAGAPTTELVNMGDFVMFGALGVNTLNLWRSDGTAEGTYLIREVDSARDPYDGGAGRVILGKVGNRVIYRGKDAANGRELWSSDGTTANTIRLTNVPFPDSFQWANSVGIVAGKMFFRMPYRSDPPITGSLWETDGTLAGTRRVAGVPDVGHGGGYWMNTEASAIFIGARQGGFDPLSSLYKYEPAQSAATLVHGALRFGAGDLFHADDSGRLFFAGLDGEPWVSDGTAAGTKLLVNIRAAEDREYGSLPQNFTDFNGALVFTADDGFYGGQLWTSDGSAAGTRRLAELSGVVAGFVPSHLIAMNGALYFFASDGYSSSWTKLTSLQAAPEVLASIGPFPRGYEVSCAEDAPLVWNGRVYFIASDASGVQLWSTDGTPAGTMPLGGIGWACDLREANARLYFSAFTPSSGRRLAWVSDGTRAGTAPLALPEGVIDARGFKAVGSNVYFSASDATRGAELWRIDASGNVVFAVDIIPGPEGSLPTPVGDLNGNLLLVVQRGAPANSREMWISDGTPAGTIRLGILPGTGPDPVILNGKAYFNRSGADGVEISVTDGTSAGTTRLVDTSPNADPGAAWFADFHGVTVFAASDPEATQLWRTDGTPAGTTRIASKVSGGPALYPPGSIGFRDRLAVGPRFFFGANLDAIGPELYALTNDLPLATADTASSNAGGAVTINVVANDSDGDGSIDPASVRISTAPANGTAVAIANGSIIYTPTPGFGGTETFSYVVDDNQRGTSTPATVTVNVTAAPTVTTTGKRGGGGALGFAELLMFLALLTIRMTRRAAEA